VNKTQPRPATRIARLFACALGFALCTALGSASAEVRDSGQTIVLPDQLDLAVQPGSFIPEQCPVGPGSPLYPIPTCIAFPAGQGSVDVQSAYGRALTAKEWRFAGGAANVFFFERPVDRPNCSQQLLMIGWLLGDEAEIAKYGTEAEASMDWSLVSHGTFIFLLMPEDVCGDDRHLR
jgi:hypothetical protein